jgi:hypothetical protein
LKEILSINQIAYPTTTSKIISIFENKSQEKYDNASLYQDILRYANDEKSSSEFKFVELANWLMTKNKEFFNYYSGSKSHIRRSARIENKRQRIQKCIDNLVEWNFLLISEMVQAKKNDTKTPLYVLTAEGEIMFRLIEAKFSINEKEKKHAIHRIIDILISIREQNDSIILLFITEFLNELLQTNKIHHIIKHFTDRILRFEINSASDFLSHLLGIKYLINWFVVDEKTSFKIFRNLKEEQKRIFLAHLKNEIEYYYQENYLNYIARDYDLSSKKSKPYLKRLSIPLVTHTNKGDLIYSGGIPSLYWEKKRIEHIDSFSKVVVPSYCDKCTSQRAFIIQIEDYLKSIIAVYGPHPSMLVGGLCMECDNWLSSFVMRLPWGSAAWE